MMILKDAENEREQQERGGGGLLRPGGPLNGLNGTCNNPMNIKEWIIIIS